MLLDQDATRQHRKEAEGKKGIRLDRSSPAVLHKRQSEHTMGFYIKPHQLRPELHQEPGWGAQEAGSLCFSNW